MNAETKTSPAAETFTASEFERLLDKAVQRVERAATPQVQPMELRTFGELERWADRVAGTDMVPKDYRGKPDNIIVAVQMGSELGLRPMQALINIATINGRPTVWGDAMLALCKMHPAYVSVEEKIAGDGDARTATCVAIRRGEPPVVRTFSVADAKTAKLWNKKGSSGQDTPWVTAPDRMLAMRARGFALRDAFPDKLRGLISTEEASDYPPEAARPYVAPASAAPPPAAAPANGDAKPKYTASMFLADIKAELDACETQAAAEAVCAQRQKGIDALKGEAAAQFKELLDMTLDRIALRADAPVPEHVATARRISEETDAMLDKGVWPGEGT